MPRRRNPVPTYRHHKASDRAFVVVYGDTGKPTRVYLGRYGSAASKAEYRRIVAGMDRSAVDVPPRRRPPVKEVQTVSGLASQFLTRCLGDYSASEATYYRSAVAHLTATAGDTLIPEFGPRALSAVREVMIGQGWTRQHVNAQVRRVRAVFRWGETLELVPPGKWFELRSLPGLKKGKAGGAKEQRKIEAVSPDTVEATLPHLTPTVTAMVRFHRLTGCRPQDVCGLTPAQIDRKTAVWVYRPDEHKRAHAGETREVYVGPQAQAVLTPYLRWDEPDRPVFRPATALAEKAAKRRADRRPKYPSQVKERQQAEKGVRLGVRDGYATEMYNQAIERAAAKAGVPHWTSNQLRHLAGEEIREAFGLDAAQKTLGHKHATTTERYAPPSDRTAEEVAKKRG